MGYTHYWELDNVIPEELEEGFKKAIPELKKVLERHKDILANWRGKPNTSPELNEYGIRFNGIDSPDKDDSHETFEFYADKKDDFNFCKTALKPYDISVCECLLILEKHIPNLIVSTDGERGKGRWKIAEDNI